MRCLAWHDGALYAGGCFDRAGEVAAVNIARWDGSQWSAVGGGFPHQGWYETDVYGLASCGGYLYAGGEFCVHCGSPADAIARWDGTSWTQPGDMSPDLVVRSLSCFEGSLYAGGNFTLIGGMSASHVARWDGSAWSPLGSGVGWIEDSGVWGLLPYRGDLVVSGNFVHAGAGFSSFIAHWAGVSAGISTPPRTTSRDRITLRMPNPYRAGSRILVLGLDGDA